VATQLDIVESVRSRRTAGRRIKNELATTRTVLLRIAAGEAPRPNDIVRHSAYGEWAQFGASLEEALCSVAAEHLERVAQSIADEIIPYAEEAVNQWPVRTGESKNGLNMSFLVVNGALNVIFRGEASYTYMIRWGVETKGAPAGAIGQSVWATLFRNPARPLSKRIAKRVMERTNGR
jgi:hypothetical protein